MKIFVSSTIFDLVDIRSEIEAFFKEVGFPYLMSDKYASDFLVKPSEDSIESCLINVRSCDVAIFVIDKRYGPSLGAEWENISATHLEYREAVKLGKSIYFFVRNRMEADYNIFKKNGDNIELNWVSKKNYKLFDFFNEHKKLNKGKSNWYYSFSDSQDLKNILKKIFANRIRTNSLTRMIQNEDIPYIDMELTLHHPEGTDQVRLSAFFTCLNRSAYDISLSTDMWNKPTKLPAMAPGVKKQRVLVFNYPSQRYAEINVVYKCIGGVQIEDTYKIEVFDEVKQGRFINHDLINKKFLFLKDDLPVQIEGLSE